jgi:hypothetical protein
MGCTSEVYGRTKVIDRLTEARYKKARNAWDLKTDILERQRENPIHTGRAVCGSAKHIAQKTQNIKIKHFND